MEEVKKKLRAELTEEYDKRLMEAEKRLKSELQSLEAREDSLANELQAKESLLEDERKKLKETLEILESELQCSICSELFINVSRHCLAFTWLFRAGRGGAHFAYLSIYLNSLFSPFVFIQFEQLFSRCLFRSLSHLTSQELKHSLYASFLRNHVFLIHNYTKSL